MHKIYFQIKQRGRARTQVPTTRNYTLELPTLGVIAGVNPVEVQWKGLILRGPPSWSRLPLASGKYAQILPVPTLVHTTYMEATRCPRWSRTCTHQSIHSYVHPSINLSINHQLIKKKKKLLASAVASARPLSNNKVPYSSVLFSSLLLTYFSWSAVVPAAPMIYRRSSSIYFFFMFYKSLPARGSGPYSEVVRYRDNPWPGQASFNPMADVQKSV